MKGDTEPPPDPQEALAMVDEALTFLRAGMEAVRRSAG
jgi:hypothetical protein